MKTLARKFSLGLVAVIVAVVLAAAGTLAYPHMAGLLYYKPRLDRLFAELHRDPVLIGALREQNATLADKDEAWALSIDRTWNAERLQGGGPLQRAMMEKPASQHLRHIVAQSGGLVSHAFLIDGKGRMAAEPFVSFNYWQFDKPKFHYTFPLGPGARDVSWLERSWDGSHAVCWRAETMVDPEAGQPIGVLALEVDYFQLGFSGCKEQPIHTPEERATNKIDHATGRLK
ncbi:MAG: hypothetical protein JOZ66_13910 [Hyphomicrobiales bacterium]|nr:hypothetical protein [Hyphomicrobiales bacterium]